ncbi:adenylyl-sulfate kinase [Salidesulfovibrio brasiliensis]|uniref:adenylyl-sulfate kinase n=1 Tax=Salidesulfovibrio brasiliensis TaxID=221711 RepID=UPI0006D1E2F6|nr:adenylyl-sulfate kinase [Salidesulfovibrio brasiliensis]
MSGWAVWFVGLPGSGKSTLARGAVEMLRQRGEDVVHLEMDVRRRAYFPNPEYTEEERHKAYAMFVDEAAGLCAEGRNVVMDAAAHRAAFRERARARIERFAEILILCDVEEAMRREAAREGGKVMADLYAKALERKRTGRQFEELGEVVGVDVPFEEDDRAELAFDNTSLTRDAALRKVLHFLDRWPGRDYVSDVF